MAQVPLAQVIEVYDSFREALSPNRIVCEMSGALAVGVSHLLGPDGASDDRQAPKRE